MGQRWHREEEENNPMPGLKSSLNDSKVVVKLNLAPQAVDECCLEGARTGTSSIPLNRLHPVYCVSAAQSRVTLKDRFTF